MGNKDSMLLEKASLSRRSFVKGLAAACAVTSGLSVVGCAGKKFTTVYTQPQIAVDDTNNIKSDDDYYTKNPKYRYGTSSHNCGGRCIIKAEVTDDNRIVRFLTDDTTHTHAGDVVDVENRNSSQFRACSRCRSYKQRLYHPGRLKYPLKQIKKRGDLSGFVRISWDQALKEISQRMNAVQGKYGPETLHAIYACGNIYSPFQSASYNGVFASNDQVSPALRLMGGASGYTSDYSFHQASYVGGWYGTAYTGFNMDGNVCIKPTTDSLAQFGKYIVLWGSNTPTTHNPLAFPWVKSIEDMKKRDKNAKVIYIGPELSEVGISSADEWIQIRPYTDTALILAMIHEMIVNTFDAKGNIRKNPWLDVDYIDSLVYGFFDSPAYVENALKFTDGTETSIGKTSNKYLGYIKTFKKDIKIPAAWGIGEYSDWEEEKGDFYISEDGTVTNYKTTNYKEHLTSRWKNSRLGKYSYNNPFKVIDEVPAGKSVSAYVLGDESLDPKSGIKKRNTNRLMLAKYGNSNFVANAYGANTPRNLSAVSYPSKNKKFRYLYKEDMARPKTPEWASKITGVPADVIRDLAKLYITAAKRNEHIWNEWAGGLQKQSEGCTNIMAIQMLCILTKDWGYSGTGIMNQGINPRRSADPAQFTYNMVLDDGTGKSFWNSIPAMRSHPQPSVAQWHNAIKYAFGDELRENGYKPKNIADWDTKSGLTETGHAYLDNGGVKALVKRTGNFDEPLKEFVDTTVTPHRTYYEYEGMESNATKPATGKSVSSGFRFILNTGGNIPINQHPNSIDLSEMYKYLPSYGLKEGYNVDNMADAFCMVTFDNFMSPSAAYSDYVLPAKTTWEQEDFKFLDESDRSYLYIDNVIEGPGESKSTWDFARDLVKYKNDDAGKNGNKAAAEFTGLKADSTFKDVFQAKYKKYSKIKEINGSPNPYYGKSWEEFLEKPFSTPTYAKDASDLKDTPSVLRAEIDKYLKGKKNTPFISTQGVTTVTPYNAYGFGNGEFAETESCPEATGKFHLYMGSLVWRYENAYSKWHGHLPLDKQGQSNKDLDGDPIVYPIVMYYNYEDYFAESYGISQKEMKEGKYFLLTTTHDRFRAHSSQAENPYLRELTHRVKDGKIYSGNDFGHYAVSNKTDAGEFNDTTFPAINSLIGEDGLPIKGKEEMASYSEIWVNPDDFKDYEDGALIKVYNNIGAVYCSIRKTERCVKGYLGLHEGCWFDPRIINGETVDVGGNCNTLMATRGSRMDHGNGAQSAMVKVERVRG